ncbi:MAG: thioredoxin family protein [Saprospiraceae bacterium]|nr:thioredoxin family protein [Saprospiraceae bacterium]
MILTILISALFNLSTTNFITDYNEALKIAEKENKQILMIFAGSDWCRPCKRFKASILDSAEFQEYAGKELVLLYLDFPAKKKNKLSDELKKQNENLAGKYNQSGLFPHLVLINKKEEVIKTIDFKDQSVDAFISECR